MSGKSKKYVFVGCVILLFVSLFIFGLNLYCHHALILNGDENVTLKLNEEYVEKGYKSAFLLDNNVKITGEVNTNKIGTYKINYKFKLLGISLKRVRTIKVIDDISPTLTLKGANEVTICPNGNYVDEGFTATDNYDGDLTEKVKTDEKADEILYTVSDTSGNKTTVHRHLVRKDTEKPIITLKGKKEFTLTVGSKFADEGYTVSDNCDQNLKVTVQGQVDTSKVGNYTLTYKTTDTSGNVATVNRTVHVRDKIIANNTSGIIYLTFDDGPSKSSTPKVLEILSRKKVKATFFVINHSSSLDYLIKQEHDAGHTVALHSYTHNYAKIYASQDAYFNDLYSIRDKVKRITGEEVNIIRFPGGTSNTVSRKYQKGIMSSLSKEVVNRGFTYFDWNVSSGDAGGAKNSTDVYNNVINGLKPNRANVVLMHDFENNTKTINALEDIIDYGLANGYIFDKIEVTTNPVRHRANN